MANKIRSIELESGVIASFLPAGIELVGATGKNLLSEADLRAILDTVKSNARANGNGTETVNRTVEKEKA